MGPQASTLTDPEEGVQGAQLHELCQDHEGPAFGDHALQPQDVGVLELAQHGRLAQKGHLQALGSTGPQGLDGHRLFPPAPGLQAAPAHFSKGAWGGQGVSGYEWGAGRPWAPSPFLSCPPPTCPDDFLYLDVCRVHLPGELSDGLAGVLVGGGVDVILHAQS